MKHILFLFLLSFVLLSCKKVTNIYESGETDEVVVIDEKYIRSHQFFMVDRLPTGAENKLRVWKLNTLKGNAPITIENVDPNLFWKYNKGNEVPSEVIIAVMKTAVTKSMGRDPKRDMSGWD